MSRRVWLTMAAVVSMALLAMGNIVDADLYSPDGVYLYDFNNHSSIWGRGFNMSVTPAEQSEIYDECADQAAAMGKEVGLIECLRPYIIEVYWTDGDGNRIHPKPDHEE